VCASRVIIVNSVANSTPASRRAERGVGSKSGRAQRRQPRSSAKAIAERNALHDQRHAVLASFTATCWKPQSAHDTTMRDGKRIERRRESFMRRCRRGSATPRADRGCGIVANAQDALRRAQAAGRTLVAPPPTRRRAVHGDVRQAHIAARPSEKSRSTAFVSSRGVRARVR